MHLRLSLKVVLVDTIAAPLADTEERPSKRASGRTTHNVRRDVLDAEHRRLMARISQSYYLEGRPKVEIAAELGISRFKVARYLEEALKTGIVSITINTGLPLPETSVTLIQHLCLKNAQVIESHGSEEKIRTAIGRAAGIYLHDHLGEAEVLGIGWGPILDSVAHGLDRLPVAEVLSLTGRYAADTDNSAFLLIHRLARLAGCQPRVITVPFFADDARQAAALHHQPEVAALSADYARLTTAMVSVGTLSPRLTSAAYVGLPERFAAQIHESQAIAEICGNLFSRDGSPVELRLHRHTVAITTHQLRRVPRVIVVAAGPHAAEAVRALCCSGVVTDLIVDVSLGKALLRMPRIPHPPI